MHIQITKPEIKCNPETYRRAHLERLIEATQDLWKQPNSHCEKCHEKESINCLFCFCPLYYEKDCGGDYIINKKGIKDCSNCTFPHDKGVALAWLERLYSR